MKTIPNVYGKLGTRADVDAKIADARKNADFLSAFGWGELTIKEDADAQTVEISVGKGKDEIPLMKALHKGGGAWLCMYNPEFYLKPK